MDGNKTLMEVVSSVANDASAMMGKKRTLKVMKNNNENIRNKQKYYLWILLIRRKCRCLKKKRCKMRQEMYQCY